jgi:hypothetical protein
VSVASGAKDEKESVSPNGGLDGELPWNMHGFKKFVLGTYEAYHLLVDSSDTRRSLSIQGTRLSPWASDMSRMSVPESTVRRRAQASLTRGLTDQG